MFGASTIRALRSSPTTHWRSRVSAAAAESATWNAWSDDTVSMAMPAPMLTDIDFDGTDMILGIRDRHGDQIVLPDYYRGYGDIMRACLNAGSYNFENNGGCGAVTTTGAGNGSGNGGGEFFVDLNGDAGRDEGALGGVSQVPGFNHIIASFYDAVSYDSTGTRMENFYTSGVQRYSNATGLMTGAYDIYLEAETGNFGKADGAGDTEVFVSFRRSRSETASGPTQTSTVFRIRTSPEFRESRSNSGRYEFRHNVDTRVGNDDHRSDRRLRLRRRRETGMSTFACGASGSVDKQHQQRDRRCRGSRRHDVVTTSDAVMDLTSNAATTQVDGVRFFDLNIPAGATITSAFIEFSSPTTGTVSSGNPTITIRAENADDSATFAAVNGNISTRATTASSVAWAPAAVARNVKFQTPSLSTLVQSVVNRTGWSSGNSMSFLFSGGAANAFRRAQTLEGTGGAASSARLVVTWTNVCTYAVNPNTKYEVRVMASNFATGQPLNGRSTSPANRDLTTNGDSRDSDGAPAGGNIVTPLTTGGAGENNHTYDFGFYVTPTAANGSIDGLVRSGGSGLPRISVMLSGGSLKEPRIVTTNMFGRYYFGDIPVGETYLVTVLSTKKYYFPFPNLVLDMQDNVSGADFEAGPVPIIGRLGGK